MRKILIVGASLAALAHLGAAFAAADLPDTLNVCTGGEGGFYEGLGNAIGQAVVKGTDVQLMVLNTGGSVENAELMKDGECDMAILQADAAITQPLPADLKVVDAHTEMVFWLHGKSSAVGDFGDMEQSANKKKYAVASVAGSGALVTLRNWIKTDDDYADVVVVEFDDWYAAAEAVAQGYVKKAGITVEIAGMLYVGRPGAITADITEDFGQQIRVGEVNDDSFQSAKDSNGNPLYTQCAAGADATSGLETSTTLSPDTYCLRAQVVYNNDWHGAVAGRDGKKLRRAVDKGINSVVKAVR